MGARRWLVAILVVITLSSSPLMAYATEWYVTPSGTAQNKGTKENPWDLKSALAAEHKEVQPGDTIWVGRGTYSVAAPTAKGNERYFISYLSGREEKPIVVRAVAGERATIDGGIYEIGNDVWFWGLEVMTSSPRPAERVVSERIDRPEGGFGAQGGARCKWINCAVHDNNEGLRIWTEATDAEVCACIVYHNGWVGTDRGHGHGIYVQNRDGTKLIQDNILWNGYAFGLHAYGQMDHLVENIHAEGNILFANGMGASPEGTSNFIIGGTGPSKGISFVGNISYMSPVTNRVNARFHFTNKPNEDLLCKDNYFVNGRFALQFGVWRKITGSGNFIFARSLISMKPLDQVEEGQKGEYSWDDNEYVLSSWPWPFEFGWTLPQDETLMTADEWKEKTGFDERSKIVETGSFWPSGVRVVVRPNKYEPGRAHIAVLNWDRAATVSVDLSTVLKKDQPYRIFNVQKLWDEPVGKGVYDGKPVEVPTLLSWLAPEFDAYLVLPSAEGDGR